MIYAIAVLAVVGGWLLSVYLVRLVERRFLTPEPEPEFALPADRPARWGFPPEVAKQYYDQPLPCPHKEDYRDCDICSKYNRSTVKEAMWKWNLLTPDEQARMLNEEKEGR